MTELDAKSNPIVVDREAGETLGGTTISYKKRDDEVLWLRPPGGGWSAPNPFVLTGVSTADEKGYFQITLAPGEIYDIAIFRDGRQPIEEQTVQTRAEAFVKVFCILKKSEIRDLITDQNQQTGGTSHLHQIHTNVETSVIRIGASRQPLVLDGAGMPQFVTEDGAPREPLDFSDDHKVELLPLLPGNHYYFAATVVDIFGNWETLYGEFDTLRRQYSVKFPTIHIYNDGDPDSYGEADFWFQVYHPAAMTNSKVIEEFYRPEDDIDDWSETDRPYAVGFAHLGALAAVRDGESEVWVRSWATEHDGVFDSDEGARSHDTRIPFPVGHSAENVPSAALLMDCPTSTVDDDFHYGVDVNWSVTYLP